jgi:hypothetical protein
LVYICYYIQFYTYCRISLLLLICSYISLQKLLYKRVLILLNLSVMLNFKSSFRRNILCLPIEKRFVYDLKLYS